MEETIQRKHIITKDSKSKMQNELKLTEDALVPLYDKLAEI